MARPVFRLAVEGSAAVRRVAAELEAGAAATQAAATRRAPAAWSLAALSGRLAELSALGSGAPLALALDLVAEAQRGGEPVAWIAGPASGFFPPDAARGGVDLAELPVVFVADAVAAARAADRLVRSGGFGLVVVDLVGIAAAEVPLPLLSRLVGLAQQHAAAVLFLTEKGDDAVSLGSLVSLRCAAVRQPAGDGRHLCVARALKDKQRGPGWSWSAVHLAPPGLR